MDDDPANNCCVCNKFSPPGMGKCDGIVFVKGHNAQVVDIGATLRSVQKSELLEGTQISSAHIVRTVNVELQGCGPFMVAKKCCKHNSCWLDHWP
ncbi:hypothetical protein DPMN_158396 [Dreissena polymorpha]|uniref:Uncharacterized protein n=1 Tax=Dreissena polymorpha TaxID=45954 RepID=A0A9D4EJ34_DREPO|nr:hypothetical protein DPMN_158396 [Dreissena polymorpha]